MKAGVLLLLTAVATSGVEAFVSTRRTVLALTRPSSAGRLFLVPSGPEVTSPTTSGRLNLLVPNSLEVTTTASPSSASTQNVGNSLDLNPQQMTYVVLTSIFVTCLIIADVIGVKLFEIPLPFEILGRKTVEHTCGMLTFPITFLLGDVINEYYGPKAAKNTVYIGLAMSMLVFVVMNIAQAMPYLDKPFNVSKESFDQIFGSAKVMYIASICAYFVGSLSDIWLFGVIKKATGGKLLWLRAAGSTVVSQVLDSFVVSYLAFSLGKELQGQTGATLPEVFNIAATGYGLKFFLSACMIPFLYLLKEILTKQVGLTPIPAESPEVK